MRLFTLTYLSAAGVQLTLGEILSLHFGRKLFTFLDGTQFEEGLDNAIERLQPHFQATADSTVSQGRQTGRLGISRRLDTCSTGWWVGPSSPRPIESWV